MKQYNLTIEDLKSEQGLLAAQRTPIWLAISSGELQDLPDPQDLHALDYSTITRMVSSVAKLASDSWIEQMIARAKALLETNISETQKAVLENALDVIDNNLQLERVRLMDACFERTIETVCKSVNENQGIEEVSKNLMESIGYASRLPQDIVAESLGGKINLKFHGDSSTNSDINSQEFTSEIDQIQQMIINATPQSSNPPQYVGALLNIAKEACNQSRIAVSEGNEKTVIIKLLKILVGQIRGQLHAYHLSTKKQPWIVALKCYLDRVRQNPDVAHERNIDWETEAAKQAVIDQKAQFRKRQKFEDPEGGQKQKKQFTGKK